MVPRIKADWGGALYSTSVACLEAAAAASGQPLCNSLAGGEIKSISVPCFNIVNGGKCRNFTQAFNEFMIVPYKAKDIFEAAQRVFKSSLVCS